MTHIKHIDFNAADRNGHNNMLAEDYPQAESVSDFYQGDLRAWRQRGVKVTPLQLDLMESLSEEELGTFLNGFVTNEDLSNLFHEAAQTGTLENYRAALARFDDALEALRDTYAAATIALDVDGIGANHAYRLTADVTAPDGETRQVLVLSSGTAETLQLDSLMPVAGLEEIIVAVTCAAGGDLVPDRGGDPNRDRWLHKVTGYQNEPA